ncbi:MAG TPA: hypothetical protein ENN69_06165, partial [Spirochaetia bacterium]|nr:hypothetical protein [Spirochaetia bacterium]
MKNFLSRLLIMLIAFPLLFLFIFILDFAHHLLFNLIVVGVSFLGAFEVSRMFRAKGIPTLQILAPLFAATLPLYTFLSELIPALNGLFGLWLAVIFSVIFFSAVFVKDEAALRSRLQVVSSSVFIVFYPAFFLMFITGMTTHRHPAFVLLFFCLPVFLNDIAAYCFGMLAHGKTRLNLPASPNKTLIGFIAGFLTSIG